MATNKSNPSGINIPASHKGRFTEWVKKNMPGKTVQQAASAILAAKEGTYPAHVVKMANFAKNAKTKFNH